MSSSVDAIDVALAVARAIESVGGNYFVGGSVASSLQGEPRATNDIDIVVELPLGRITAFIAALGEDFEVDSTCSARLSSTAEPATSSFCRF